MNKLTQIFVLKPEFYKLSKKKKLAILAVLMDFASREINKINK